MAMFRDWHTTFSGCSARGNVSGTVEMQYSYELNISKISHCRKEL